MTVVAGQQYALEMAMDFQFGSSSVGSATADFLDPATLVNVSVTDPTTGMPIFGATIASDAGTVFPINNSAVPEPAYATVTGALVMLCVFVVRSRSARARRQAVGRAGIRLGSNGTENSLKAI